MVDEKIKAENQQKKEYLGNYRQHVHRISRIEAELEEIRIMKSNPSAINNDGMPRGSDQRDLSDFVALLDEMERELLEERHQRTLSYKDIAGRIKNLKNRHEEDVLFYRYIKGLEWHEIAEQMGYTERWVYKMHGKALAHLEIVQSSSKKVQFGSKKFS